MNEVQLLKVRLRQDKVEEALRWMRSLAERGQEVEELLGLEGINAESLFLECDGDAYYLYQYVRAENLQKAYEAFARARSPLAQQTRQHIEETWEQATALEVLADWELPDQRR